MKVKKLIKKLLEYNMDAEVDVVTDNKSRTFSLSWGGEHEESEKKECTVVSLYVDETCGNDSQHMPKPPKWPSSPLIAEGSDKDISGE